MSLRFPIVCALILSWVNLLSAETRVESEAAALRAFTGSGELEFFATASNLAAIEGPRNVLSLATSPAALAVELEFTDAPIPEPKGYAVLIGVLGFGLVLWGRRQRGATGTAGKEP